MLTIIEMFHKPTGEGVDQMANLVKKLRSIGFEIAFGNFDYEHQWEDDLGVSPELVIQLVDKTLAILGDFDVVARFKTKKPEDLHPVLFDLSSQRNIVTKLKMYHQPTENKGNQLTDIIDKLSSIGFSVSLGDFDYEYQWESDIVTEENIVKLVNTVLTTLEGCDVYIRFSTKSQDTF